MQNHSKLNHIFAFSLLAIFSLNFCSPSQEDKLRDWQSATSEISQESGVKLAMLAFHHSFREAKWDPLDKTLYVEYGGSSALTFTDSKMYKPTTLLDLAAKSYRMYHFGKEKGIETVRISLIKPFYVKNAPNPETEIQEFEVYRIRFDQKVWEKLPHKEDVDLFQINEDGLPDGLWRENLDILMDSWKVELDEFARIEVK